MMKRFRFTNGLITLLSVIVFIAIISCSGTFGFILMLIALGITCSVLLYSAARQARDVFFRSAPHSYSNDATLKFTATLMGLFFVTGTMLYVLAFWTISKGGAQYNNAEYLLRSMGHSFSMFTFNFDSTIMGSLDKHPVIKAFVALQTVLSFSCTVALFVGLVYSRLKAYYKFTFKSKIDSNHNHLYLFFSVNDPSQTLIKDIIRHDPNAVIVLIDEANVKEDTSREWEGIVNLLTQKRKVIEIADKHAVRVTIAGKQLKDIDKEIASSPDFNALAHIGISSVAKMIDKAKNIDGGQVHIFFLDDNEESNIRNVINLAKDKTILSLAKEDKILHRIYCHARYNGPNRVIQDLAIKKNLDIKIIDSSHIAVERLKLDSSFHPVNVIDINDSNPCTVSESFDALIIGFGEVGRDAFRFLYEFAAFIDGNAHGGHAIRSQFNCTIVDKNIDQLEGPLKAGMPGIFKTDHKNIVFKNSDYNHDSFYNEILTEEKIKQLNYVVISIGDNDEAIALATKIFTRFRQYGGDLDKLMILVRCTDDAKVEAVQKIADHYNWGYGKSKKNNPVIRIFGQPEQTYSYELIISNRLVEMGKRFHENYCAIKGDGKSWDDRRKSLANTHVADLDNLRKLNRQESQDLVNALHIPTKMAFFRHALPNLYDWTGFFVRYFNADGSPNRTGKKAHITYPELSERENLVILRLAMLEHIRWNAAHELLGYVRRTDGVPKCDEKTMQHNCLINWDELDKGSERTERTDYPCDYKEYDFAVVDTTISMSDQSDYAND